MTATLTWLCRCVAQLRVYREGQSPGECGRRMPYCWCATVVRSGDTAEVQGAMRAPKPSERRAIRVVLLAEGFKPGKIWGVKADGRVYKMR